jgi:hypothetical protein
MSALHRASFTTALFAALALLAVLAASPLVRAQNEPTAPDPELLFAIDSLWGLDRPAISTLAEGLQRRDGSEPVRFEADVRDGLAYLHTSAEGAAIEYARKRFDSAVSPWGALPRLDPASARLFEVGLARKRYLVLSGVGEGLFRIGDWQRFGFLHVVDVTQRWATIHYPLVAEAGLRERVIGRLPGSPVLNYLRLVPAQWSDARTVDRYEVLVYALNPKGAERVTGPDGQPLAYTLSRLNPERRWKLEPATATAVADARDAAGASFSAPPADSERSDRATAPAATSAAPSSAPVAAPQLSTPPDAAPQAAGFAAGEVAAKPAAEAEALNGSANAASDVETDAEALAKSKAREGLQDAAEDSAGSAFKKKLPVQR